MKCLKSVIIAVLVVAMSLTVTGQVLAGRGHHGGSGSGTWANSSGTSDGTVYGRGAGSGACPYGGTGNFAGTGVNILKTHPQSLSPELYPKFCITVAACR